MTYIAMSGDYNEAELLQAELIVLESEQAKERHVPDYSRCPGMAVAHGVTSALEMVHSLTGKRSERIAAIKTRLAEIEQWNR